MLRLWLCEDATLGDGSVVALSSLELTVESTNPLAEPSLCVSCVHAATRPPAPRISERRRLRPLF